MDALLLPISAALPKRRRLPPPVRVPLNRTEALDLFIWRYDCGFLLHHPHDDFYPPEMSKNGFGGSGRLHHGRGLGRDLPPEFVSMDEVAEQMQMLQTRSGAA